ncbi:hypothetical protein [Mesobacillus foraminis]|uniref:Uncharacterized protein n=1 Tax=Mesobacillus foraminis TaxID=279826 RepID=A0A4R2B8U7_9BACI|nr:hypothetical protein [Mesobacillus foraminis]TCN22743.1 hypothetical protein EV146_110229 [Mesobacillus foraminis]
MFVAWLITVSLFLICISATFIIINGLKEKDQYDLVVLHSQYKNITINNKGIKKLSA